MNIGTKITNSIALSGFGKIASGIQRIKSAVSFHKSPMPMDSVEIRNSVDSLMRKKNINFLLDGNINFAEENYSRESDNFIRKFAKNFPAYNKGLKSDEHQDIMLMYKTTTPQNIDTRLEIMDKFRNVYQTGSNPSEIHSMRLLFDRLDRDEHAKKFVKKAFGDDIHVESIGELNKVINIVPNKKAEIFHRNISRIVRLTSPVEREQAITENIENPFFANPRIRQRGPISIQKYKELSYVEKIGKFIENKINIRRYNQLLKNEAKTEQKNIFATVAIPDFEQTISQTPESDFCGISLVKSLKKHPKLKKLKVQSDVNDIIKEKLGEKTYEKQQGLYSVKATAIKLKLLPNIFESIKSTRKTQKSNGIKPTVKNSDAVKLYEKIQGKNRKLVRYMLNKTDENNNRLFNIKDIITIIDNTENNIATQKKLNPEFRAKDSKEYYDNIYNDMVEKYGKLKRTKK